MTYRARKQRQSRRGGARGFLAIGGLLIVAAIAIAVVAGVGWVLAVAASGPGLDELDKQNPGTTSKIFAADGSLLGFVQSDTLRAPVGLEKIPEVVEDATIAIEDENFYEHSGVDYGAVVRAGLENVTAGRTLQGGSTITQQLARILYIENPERNIERKIREARIAMEIEDEHSKSWILSQYLNAVPYGTVNGRTALGIESASEVFFSKQAKDLTLPEAALLAGLPQAPSQYNPFQNARGAIARRNEVLDAMAQNEMISMSEARGAQAADLGVKSTDRFTTKREGYFFDYIQQALIDEYGVQSLRQGGLDVYTTIDPALQDAGRSAISTSLTQPTDPSSTVVAIDPSDGAIRAMASSGTYGDRDFNLAAQGHRQPGSSFKTFVLATAVLQGIDPSSTNYTSRSPITLTLPGFAPWKVETFGGNSAGNISLEKATLLSDNSVYAQLIADVGPENVKQTAEALGVTSKLNGFPAEGLGGLETGVSPLEMANAYATLANGGVRHTAHGIERVEFPNGDTDEFGDEEGERVMTDGEAYAVTDVLRQNVLGGTGTAAQIGCSDGTAGKTGTTDQATDVWFVGYTPQLSTSVWVGYPDDRRPIAGGTATGGGVAAPIWQDFMTVANPDCKAFPTPSDPADLQPFDSDRTVGGEDEATTTDETTTDETTTDEEAPDKPGESRGFEDPGSGGGSPGGRGNGGPGSSQNLDPDFYE